MKKSDSSEWPGRFTQTHWSMVVAAGLDDSSKARDALQTLCQVYWYPLYAFTRRQGYRSHDAEDLTQAFFTRLLAKGDLAGVSREKGRFRSFLLASMKHFLANEWDRTNTQKRGGGVQILPIDFHDADARYANEPTHEITPDKLYERRWAMTILDQALVKLRVEMNETGKEKQFDAMKQFLTGGKGDVPYKEVAESLGISESSVKVTVHRLRRRYGELLREEVSQTLDEKENVEEELRNLLTALSG
ncbi:MAG: sigma-70 family RNA polymerase sigma factor [Verrucomicrobiota bacterium]